MQFDLAFLIWTYSSTFKHEFECLGALDHTSVNKEMSRPAFRTLGIFGVLAITTFIVLDALGIAVAVLRASGPCQPDNEAS